MSRRINSLLTYQQTQIIYFIFNNDKEEESSVLSLSYHYVYLLIIGGL